MLFCILESGAVVPAIWHSVVSAHTEENPTPVTIFLSAPLRDAEPFVFPACRWKAVRGVGPHVD